MRVQFNTNSSIEGRDELARLAEKTVGDALQRFSAQITRVEVHLSDVNSIKPGERDIRCLLEARLKGLRPVAASHLAGTPLLALEGAANKLQRVLDGVLGKLSSR